MRIRILSMVLLVGLLLWGVAVVAADVSPRSNYPVAVTELPKTPTDMTLAPGASHWYKFVVDQEYSMKQFRFDQNHGAPIEVREIRMDFQDAYNPALAHETGFRLYDPYHVGALLEGKQFESFINEHGFKVTPTIYWAIGSPEVIDEGILSGETEGIDVFLGAPKVWQGVLHDAGVYYIEVYNETNLPLIYTLTMTSFNVIEPVE